MTVRELINKLQSLPEDKKDLIVTVMDDYYSKEVHTLKIRDAESSTVGVDNILLV